jgi:hypothetical protein
MKKLITVFACFLVWMNVIAQSTLQETIEVNKNQKVNITISDANLINVSGWDENHILVKATVRINNGKNDDSYKINTENKNGEVYIEGFIQEKSQLPRIIQIKKGDQVYSFNTDDMNSPDIQKFYEEQGHDGIQWTSHGVMWDIQYEISIPQHVQLNINSKFGLIDIENFNGSIQANSKHGGVDLAVNTSSKMDFNLRSDWGEIFTDLDLRFDKNGSKNWTQISCDLNGGGGTLASLESKHGNIYLRASK